MLDTSCLKIDDSTTTNVTHVVGIFLGA